LLDFGISKFTAGSGELSLTRTGFAIGTPHFMSPEQATGSKEIDIRTDLYSLGVILYQCFSGQLPYDADNYNALLVQILSKPPPPLEQLVPDLEPRAAAIVARAMERRPDDRFQSAVEFQGTVAGLVAPLPAAASGAPKEGVDPPPVVPAPPAAPLQDIGPTKSSWEAVGTGKPATKRTRTVIVAVVGVAVAVAGALAIKMGGGATAIPATADQRAAPHARSAPASAAAPVPAPSSPPAPSRAANDQPDAGDAASPSGEVRKRPISPGRAKKKSPARAGRSRSKPEGPDGHPEAEPRPPTTEQQPSGPARVIVRQL
jgi:serine/threonine-protein kinase